MREPLGSRKESQAISSLAVPNSIHPPKPRPRTVYKGLKVGQASLATRTLAEPNPTYRLEIWRVQLRTSSADLV